MEDDGAVADSDSSSDSDLDLVRGLRQHIFIFLCRLTVLHESRSLTFCVALQTREEIQEMAREWMLNDSTFRQIFILRG